MSQANEALWPIYASRITNIGSEYGSSPGWRQAIIWANDDILSIGPKLQWNFNQSNIFIQESAFESVVREMTAICLGPNVLLVMQAHELSKTAPGNLPIQILSRDNPRSLYFAIHRMQTMKQNFPTELIHERKLRDSIHPSQTTIDQIPQALSYTLRHRSYISMTFM